MKRKKEKRKTDSRATSAKHKKLLRTRYIASAGIVLAAAIYIFVLRQGETPHIDKIKGSENDHPADLKPEDQFKVTVERAYEIDAQFQRVYNAAWEAANGAIGEAFLYAATGDANLLNVYQTQRNFIEMSNGTWVDDRAWVCLAELYWGQFSGKKHSEWVQDAKKRYDEAREEGRLSHHEGFWSWYSYAPNSGVKI